MEHKAASEIAIGLFFMGIALAFGLANFGEDKITIIIEHKYEASPDVLNKGGE